MALRHGAGSRRFTNRYAIEVNEVKSVIAVHREHGRDLEALLVKEADDDEIVLP